jgi:hypothetical protein
LGLVGDWASPITGSEALLLRPEARTNLRRAALCRRHLGAVPLATLACAPPRLSASADGPEPAKQSNKSWEKGTTGNGESGEAGAVFVSELVRFSRRR